MNDTRFSPEGKPDDRKEPATGGMGSAYPSAPAGTGGCPYESASTIPPQPSTANPGSPGAGTSPAAVDNEAEEEKGIDVDSAEIGEGSSSTVRSSLCPHVLSSRISLEGGGGGTETS